LFLNVSITFNYIFESVYLFKSWMCEYITQYDLYKFTTLNLSRPIAPGGALHSTVSDMLKFLSANIGLIKTELDDAMQESHLIRLATGRLLPNNLQASDNNIGLYVGLGWFITTNFGHEVIWHNGATVVGYNAYMAFNPTTERGIVILCYTDLSDINITTISFNQNDELSSLIWSLLNQ
jgi:serine-type D-Ala-D-Ala carboxypeptidase/endopeptidase